MPITFREEDDDFLVLHLMTSTDSFVTLWIEKGEVTRHSDTELEIGCSNNGESYSFITQKDNTLIVSTNGSGVAHSSIYTCHCEQETTNVMKRIWEFAHE
jgi:hypothetical protein